MCDGHDEQQEMVDKFNLVNALQHGGKHQSTLDCCVQHETVHHHEEQRQYGQQPEPFRYSTVDRDTWADNKRLYAAPSVVGMSYATKKAFEDSQYRKVVEPHIEHKHFRPLALN